LGSLLVGSGYAKGLAIGLDVPLIPINHMDAHVMAHFIDEPTPEFPFLCLVVSGGHTQLVRVEADFSMTIIGKTKDDAAGEAFDKTAKMLGLPYPGGPLVDAYAQKGNPLSFSFPKAKMPGYDFSFSGLKTAILYFLKEKTAQEPDFISHHLADICASVQHTIVEILLYKLKKAIQQTGIKHVCIAGGVSANSGVRNGIEALGQKMGIKTYLPAFQYCTDNAAMIAITAHYKYINQAFEPLSTSAHARSNW
jgi:N6-L-threonylcarbamoyladenine synthase